jgi:hypothetical protein
MWENVCCGPCGCCVWFCAIAWICLVLFLGDLMCLYTLGHMKLSCRERNHIYVVIGLKQ